MQLFERVKLIAKHYAGSDKALASCLGLKQPTFFGYLNERRQDALYPLLPKILELYPQVRRDWLYFGEGEMTGTGPSVAVPPLRAACAQSGTGEADAREVAALHQKLLAAHEMNARLTDELLRLNEERRGLVERLEWEKSPDKPALFQRAVPGVPSDKS